MKETLQTICLFWVSKMTFYILQLYLEVDFVYKDHTVMILYLFLYQAKATVRKLSLCYYGP